MESKTSSLNNPRQNALNAMRDSVLPEQWERNAKFTESLRRKIKDHAIRSHPAIEALEKGQFSINAIRQIHLEYRHAIVQLFTDALLMAQVQARQLEPRLRAGSKMAPRFLLTLNILDEFGFEAGLDSSGYYRGNPALAHYPLFENVLNDLGIDQHQREKYAPSKFARDLHDFLQKSFDDYSTVVALLAAAEEQVIIFSPALRSATSQVGVGVDRGYYHVHGTSEHENTNAHDDDHEADLWAALNQACTDDAHERLEVAVMTYLDMWYGFWSRQQLTGDGCMREVERDRSSGTEKWQSA
jgi:pyrroloquinoline quinone (PQQ) biosynthesis protein C